MNVPLSEKFGPSQGKTELTKYMFAILWLISNCANTTRRDDHLDVIIAHFVHEIYVRSCSARWTVVPNLPAAMASARTLVSGFPSTACNIPSLAMGDRATCGSPIPSVVVLKDSCFGRFNYI